MKHRVFAAVLVSSLLAVAVAVPAHAAGSPEIVTKVAFPFQIGETTLPAGSYKISVLSAGASLKIRAVESAETLQVSVLTRLARREKSDKGNLVFDTVGEQKFLSEVWMPGIDGFLVRGTTEEHGHELVGGSTGS